MTGTSRSYGQMCGLAVSLDVLGDRWTFLLIRELARGPKRFGDLLSGLEGMGTNLLSTRLRSLEAAEVIERVRPAGSSGFSAYALGPRGVTLEPILEELALWGFDFLDPASSRLEPRAAWAAMSMKAHMVRAEIPPPLGTFAFEVDQEAFWLHVSENGTILRDGCPDDYNVRVKIGLDGFFALATGAATAVEAGARIEGDEGSLDSLLHTFRLPGT